MFCQEKLDSKDNFQKKKHAAEEELNNSYNYSNLFPIGNIGKTSASINQNLSTVELQFYCKILILTIDSLFHYEYSNFDAHTTSTCCHGIALYAREIISACSRLDLQAIRLIATHKIANIDNSLHSPDSLFIPMPLIELSRLFICAYIKESDPNQKRRTLTRTKKLQEIAPISTNFCNRIAHGLQKYFSNLIAKRYIHYLNQINNNAKINNIPIKIWGKYIQSDHLRVDKRGTIYSPCLYSMQVSLAFLISTQAKIAVVNDLKDSEDKMIGRQIYILQGDGIQSFRTLSYDEILEQEETNTHDSVIIFSGCAHMNHRDFTKSISQFQKHIEDFPRLVLACDTYYPQFPEISDDAYFSNQPIVPLEESLQSVIAESAKTSGVSMDDPSLFCLTHIYSCSFKQVLKVVRDKCTKSLPISFIPKGILASKISC